MSLEFIARPPSSGKTPTHLLVALHGWGGNSDDLVSLASVLDLPDFQGLFPNAPFPHPSVPKGRAWYDLARQDHRGLTESRQHLHAWLQSLEGEFQIPLQRTIILGFSQGGAMALDVGLQLPVAGLCILSGYLHGKPLIGETPPPILIAHGRNDEVVPRQAAQQAKNVLETLHLSIQYREFLMGHDIRLEEMVWVRQFIEKCCLDNNKR